MSAFGQRRDRLAAQRAVVRARLVELGDPERVRRFDELRPPMPDPDPARAVPDDEPGWGHLDGKPWHAHPAPRRWHRCRPHSWGYLFGGLVERCACGARRDRGRGRWYGRNAR